jgi:hypothetical protein
MPILSEKYIDSFTLAMSPHQHGTTSIPDGELAFFIFIGLSPWSEQDKLTVANIN